MNRLFRPRVLVDQAAWRKTPPLVPEYRTDPDRMRLIALEGTRRKNRISCPRWMRRLVGGDRVLKKGQYLAATHGQPASATMETFPGKSAGCNISFASWGFMSLTN